MNIRIKFGRVKLGKGSNVVRASYSGFSSTPVVTAIVEDCLKLGPNVSVRDVSPSGCTFYCYYNGGEELYEGTIAWTAVGYTSEQKVCGCSIPPHKCPPNVYF